MNVINLEDIRHGIRVGKYSSEIAKMLHLSQDKTENIYIAGLWHDIGKAYIDQEILYKPGALTVKEKNEMKKHTVYSYQEILNMYPEDIALDILHHHENFDGTGYPKGLKGSEIPIGARILKIADVFDALTMERPYRGKLTVDEALKIMQNEKSTYDPELYLLFVQYINSKDIEFKECCL